MLTIALVGQKGGAGKSTVVWALGNAALARGKRVVMIETDNQGSTVNYVEKAYTRYPDRNLEDVLRVAELKTDDATEIDTALTELAAQGFDYCLIDTQGAHSEQSRSLMVMADRIIIPAPPVDHIYDSQMATVASYNDVAQALREYEPDAEVPPCGILLNNFNPNEKLNNEQKEVLAQFLEHPLCLKFYLPKRNGFQTLGSGKIIKFEIESKTKREWVARDALERDLSEADDTLTAIEGMT